MFNKKEYYKQYREDNPEKIKEYRKQWYKNNPEKVKEQNKQYREDNPEYHKQWRKDNPEKVEECRNKWKKNKRKVSTKYNLTCKMSSAIRKSLKSNKEGRHWEGLVGYTLKDLIRRLKKTVPSGYTWQDFLEGKLHVDHIIPISVFNFTNSNHIDFKRCWALSNLQLLPAKENIIKHNKLIKSFQPALKI